MHFLNILADLGFFQLISKVSFEIVRVKFLVLLHVFKCVKPSFGEVDLDHH